ncbi:unnamed protein product [Knipowitschia caucasica]|uniref:C3H1-type domain-containing protein n=1 Tax=Knipowitschia caucasica TaxID=637954 RepID=A0AAV2MCD9_KNICA
MASLELPKDSCSAEERGNDAHQSDPIHSQELPTVPPDAPDASDENHPSVELNHTGKNKAVLCQYYVMGRCRFGDKCRQSHCEFPLESETVGRTEDENEDSSKKKKVKAKQRELYKEKETTKKPRMRTADDVISRILWDSSVDSDQFVVGYVDRFLGVLERPFDDFNWDTDPCDCDYTTELALPRHRIQYFTYRGQRLWDRHSRTDRVFGSTGQALAPPFGGKAEVEEEIETLQTDVETCTVNGDVENERQNEMNIDASESDLQPPGQDTSATNRAMDRSANEDEENQKQEALNVAEVPAESEQQEERPGGRPPKKRPTHFVTFRANTPSVLACFEQLQAELTAALPASAPHWSSISCLHVTLCLLVLPGEEEVQAAVEVLQRYARWNRNPPLTLTFPLKLKHFNGRVLYVSPQPRLQLQQFNSGLQEAYREQGLLHRDSFNPRYHLTLAKTVGLDADRIFQGVENLKVGRGLNFGRLPVNTLHLCTIGGCDEDGFYDILCTVTLR